MGDDRTRGVRVLTPRLGIIGPGECPGGAGWGQFPREGFLGGLESCLGTPGQPEEERGSATNPAARARGSSIFGNNPRLVLRKDSKRVLDSHAGNKSGEALPCTI